MDAYDTEAGDRHATAKALLAELWNGRSGSLSTQVLQEFYAIVTRKFKPAMPRAKARAIVAAYGEWCAGGHRLQRCGEYDHPSVERVIEVSGPARALCPTAVAGNGIRRRC